MDLPDAVLASKLLDNANLDYQSKKLALTACQDIKFAAMKFAALTRIFHDRSMSNDSPSTSLAIKQEVTFTTVADLGIVEISIEVLLEEERIFWSSQCLSRQRLYVF